MSISNLKKLIFLSYYFPPRPEIGGKRVDKLCALALSRGWEPIVVSTRGEVATDNSLAAQSERFSLSLIDRTKKGTKSWLGRFIRVLSFGSADIIDILELFVVAFRIKTSQQIRVVMATMPPRQVVIAALLMKLLDRSIFLVSDFRDPWDYSGKFGVKNILNRFLLHQVLCRSDLILSVTQANLETLSKAVNINLQQKSLVIPNAVDVHLYDKIPSINVASKGKIVFGHLGDLEYVHRNPAPLLRVTRDLKKENPSLCSELEIHFWGKSGIWAGVDLAGQIMEYGLQESVFWYGTVDQQTALGIVKGLDVLILFAFNQPLQIPAKTYEYLLSGKPILAFCEECSETHKLLVNYPGIEFVTSLEPSAIRLAIEKMVLSLKSDSASRIQREFSSINYQQVFTPVFERIEQMLFA